MQEYARQYPEGMQEYARVCKAVLRGYARVCKAVLRGYAYHKTSQQQSCSVRSTFAGGISLACQPSQHPTCPQHEQEYACVCVCVWEG